MKLSDFDYIAATAKFYEVLFAEIPAIRSKFENVESQTAMFQVALKFVLSERRGSEKLQTFLKDLGVRHRKLGLQRMHLRIGRRAFSSALLAGDPRIDQEAMDEYSRIFTMLEEAMGFSPLSDDSESS